MDTPAQMSPRSSEQSVPPIRWPWPLWRYWTAASILTDLHPDFPPDQHCLNTVKSLAGEIGPNVYQKFFRERLQFADFMRAKIIVGGKEVWNLDHSAPYSNCFWTFDSVTGIRELVKAADDAAQGPCVILAEGVGETGVQALGMALDVNPSFFARHLGSTSVWEQGSGELTTLDLKYSDLLETKRKQESADLPTGFTRPSQADCVRLKGNTFDHYDVWDDTDAMYHRMKHPSESYDAASNIFYWDGFKPRISYCRVSAKAWLVLVDPAFRLPRPGPAPRYLYFPRHGAKEVDFGPPHCPLFPSKLADGGPRSRFSIVETLETMLTPAKLEYPRPVYQATSLLFPVAKSHADASRATDAADLLPVLLALTAWVANTKSLEHLLAASRLCATEDLTPNALRNLALLRPQIADLQQGLQYAQGMVPKYCETAYAKLRGALEDATGLPEALAAHFQPLVDRADALSKALEQEVQLVIAAAAVQDPPISKRQKIVVLTLLAAFYLPLVLITGILGFTMKGSEATASSLRLCFEVLVAIIAAVLLAVSGYLLWDFVVGLHDRRRQEMQYKSYKMA